MKGRKIVLSKLVIKLKNSRCFNNLAIFIFFLIISFVGFSIMISTHSILGQGDIAFHFRRVFELRESILHRNFFPMFSFNQYHGSAIMTLYPYMNLYPLAFLSIFIKSSITLLYIWYISNILLILLISFYSGYHFNKCFSIDIIFSIVYSTSAIVFNSGVDDFGEITSFALLPLILFGVLNLLNNNNYIELSIGIVLIFGCHILSTLIAAIFIMLLLLLNINKLDKNKLYSLIKSFFIITLITSCIWIPIAQFMYYNKTSIFSPAHPNLSYFYGTHSSNIFVIILRDLLNVLAEQQQPDLFALFGIILSFLFYKRLSYLLKSFLWMSIALILIISNIFPWKFVPRKILSMLGIFQAPQRFFIIAQLLLSYIFAYCIIKCLIHSNVYSIFILMIILFLVLYILKIGAYTLLGKLQLYSVVCCITVIFLTLVAVLVIFVIKRNYPYNMKKSLLVISIILLALIAQLDTQRQMITQRFQQGQNITKKYFDTNIRNTQNASAWDWINKSNQFKYFISFKSSPTVDYYPILSVKKSNAINNNDGLYNNKRIKFYHYGYNKFIFYTNKGITNLSLPLLDYNNKYLYLYINNHLVKHFSNKNNMVTVKKIYKGYHVINIHYRFVNHLQILKIIFLMLGLSWMLLDVSKKYYIK